MKGAFAFIVAALAVGVVVVFGLPQAEQHFPETISRNQYVRTAAVGAVVLGGIWAAFHVLKLAKIHPKLPA